MAASPISQEHREALEALQRVIARMYRDFHFEPPCSGDDSAMSSHKVQRNYVRDNLCPTCPLNRECLEVGKHEIWGVWGGVDMTRDQG